MRETLKQYQIARKSTDSSKDRMILLYRNYVQQQSIVTKPTRRRSRSRERTSLKKCPKGKERVGSKCFTACKEGQYRSEYNRCKSFVANPFRRRSRSRTPSKCPKGKERVGSKCFTACKEGQYRSEYNRCRSLATKPERRQSGPSPRSRVSKPKGRYHVRFAIDELPTHRNAIKGEYYQTAGGTVSKRPK